MIVTEAYIAGGLGKAIVKTDDEFFVASGGRDGFQMRTMRNPDINGFLLNSTEVVVKKDIRWSETELCDSIELEKIKQQALDFFLIGMDTTLDTELRALAIGQLEEGVLDNQDVVQFVENRVFSTVVPNEFNPQIGSELCLEKGYSNVHELYSNLELAMPIILHVREYWQGRLTTTWSSTIDELEELDREFTDKGVFSDFVLSSLDGDVNMMDGVVVKWGIELKDLEFGHPIGLFLSDLKDSLCKAFQITDSRKELVTLSALMERDSELIKSVEQSFSVRFNNLISNFKGRKQRIAEYNLGKKGVKLPRLRNDIEADEKVTKLINWIKLKTSEGDLDEVESRLLELVEFQDLNSERKHLCKSLCDVAKGLQLGGFTELSDLLARKAINLQPKDLVPPTIIADNLRINHLYKESLSKYKEIENSMGVDAFVLCGKAETLSKMGRLDESFEVYSYAAEKYQDNVVPKTGKGYVLLQMGRYEEALSEFDFTISKFPNEPYAWNGKAEALIRLRRTDEALLVYDKASKNSNIDNKVSLNGKANLHRLLGQFDLAIEIYDGLIQTDSNDLYAQNGRSETLKRSGRLDEALAAYNDTIVNFPNSPVAWSGKAETLRQLGQLAEALAVYDFIIGNFPNNIYAISGKAETLRQIGRTEDALALYETGIRKYKFDVALWNGKAETLRQIGDLEKAEQFYEKVIRKFPYDPIANRAKFVVSIQRGLNLEVVKLNIEERLSNGMYDDTLNHIYCMLLLKLNLFEEAIVRLEHGLSVVKKSDAKEYYRTALAFAYVKKGDFKHVTKLEDEKPSILPAFKVLVSHAYAADGNTAKSNEKLSGLIGSPWKKLDDISKCISDRYNLSEQVYFLGKSTDELDSEIENLEFELLTEPYLLAA